jgi:hypothetical protein
MRNEVIKYGAKIKNLMFGKRTNRKGYNFIILEEAD